MKQSVWSQVLIEFSLKYTVLKILTITINILSLDIYCFENCIDPDQLASEKPAEKPADLDLHCFPRCL